MKAMLPLLLLLSLTYGQSQAGISSDTSSARKNRTYWASTGEVIYSGARPNFQFKNAQNEFQDISTRIVPRFTLFLHLFEQLHVDFGKSTGMYTGIALRNIGMVNRLADSITFKQRAYSVGIPLAFKIGDMAKRSYFALGGEMEFFFHYKQKSWVGSRRNKIRESVWLDERMRLFNPSVFIEANLGNASYIKLRYYPLSWLNEKQSIRVNDGNTTVSYNLRVSDANLFSITLGKLVDVSRKRKEDSGRARNRQTEI